MKKPIISISNNFVFSYGLNTLFEANKYNEDISFERGKIYGIFGENGCGKTTLLNVINTFLNPVIGQITYNFSNYYYVHKKDSKQIPNENLISNYIRRSFQIPLIIDEFDTYTNIWLAKRVYSDERFINTFFHKNTEIRQDEILYLLSLANMSGEEPSKSLSYGERRIISNFQLIYSNAELLILDEPFANLHPDIIRILKMEYKKKVINDNVTIIIVEHKDVNIENFADEIISIKNGIITKELPICL